MISRIEKKYRVTEKRSNIERRAREEMIMMQWLRERKKTWTAQAHSLIHWLSSIATIGIHGVKIIIL